MLRGINKQQIFEEEENFYCKAYIDKATLMQAVTLNSHLYFDRLLIYFFVHASSSIIAGRR